MPRFRNQGLRPQTFKTNRIIATILCVVILIFNSAASSYATVLNTDVIGTVSVSDRGLTIIQSPDVVAKAGILVDDAGNVLWGRSVDEKRSIASITKIMTAVVALDVLKPDQVLTVPREATQIGESSANLRLGEEFPVSNLIEALLIPSGNDAAITLAFGASNGVEPFVKLMNTKAVELGMKNTHFANPDGLEEEGHYSTASDISLLVRYAMKNQIISSAVGKSESTIGSHVLKTTNEMLGVFPGTNGVKTGFTDEAGYCFASGVAQNGIQLWAVVLGSTSSRLRFGDSENLYTWGLEHYKKVVLGSKDQLVGKAALEDYLNETIPAVFPEDISTTIFDYNGEVSTQFSMLKLSGPIQKGDTIGSVSWIQNSTVIASSKVVAGESFDEPRFIEGVGISLSRMWRSVFGGQKVAKTKLTYTAPLISDPSGLVGEDIP